MTVLELRLGVNIDHVATVRNARGGTHPDPVRAAHLAQTAGADGITAHLREDRRHMTDADIDALMQEVSLPLNLEIAATREMQKIALRHQPHAICLVPERREERTTEGGLNVVRDCVHLGEFIKPFVHSRISFFIAPDLAQVKAAAEAGADIVELHTGTYCNAVALSHRQSELQRLREVATYAHKLGIEVHAGHGLTYETVSEIASIPEVVELNIGHFLIGEAIFTGLEASIYKMRTLMNKARI